MDMAAIDWCKLFGNDDKATQPSHWKNIIPVSEHDAFRAGILNATGLDDDGWAASRKEIVDYRNTMAAHLDEQSKRPPAHFAGCSTCFTR